MPLKIDQRVERLQARLRELAFWRARATREIDGWRCDGQPIVVGAPWPRRDGVLRFEALASVPDAWPLDETRLWLDLGGESLLTLRYDGGESAAFGLDVNHQEFPLAGRRVAIASESVARRPFGQPVADPRLQRALFVWLDLALARFADRLALVVEAAETLGAHDAVEPLVDAAEAAPMSCLKESVRRRSTGTPETAEAASRRGPDSGASADRISSSSAGSSSRTGNRPSPSRSG